jgi:hypothetical protein
MLELSSCCFRLVRPAICEAAKGHRTKLPGHAAARGSLASPELIPGHPRILGQSLSPKSESFFSTRGEPKRGALLSSCAILTRARVRNLFILWPNRLLMSPTHLFSAFKDA